MTSATSAKWQATGAPGRGRRGRLLLGADLLGLPAPGAEPAARRRVRRARDVALEHDALPRALALRVGHGHGRQQRLRVRVRRRSYTCARVPVSTILPRYMTATRSEMWRTTDRSWAMNRYDEPELVLQLLEQVDHAGLDRDVERRHGLVEDEDLRVAATARARCRRAGAGRRRTRAGSGSCAPDSSRRAGRARARAAARSSRSSGRAPSAARRRCRRPVMRGSSEAYGSWKTICSSWRKWRSELRAASSTPRPGSEPSPASPSRAAARCVRASSCRSRTRRRRRASRPPCNSKVTPETAWTSPVLCRNSLPL